MLAPWVISQFPPHRVYTEVFGGGASILMRKPRAYAEIYNDLDSEVVNVFRVLRDRGNELREALRLTPFAREEFMASYTAVAEPIERARRTIERSFMGFGSDGTNSARPTGFRAASNRSGTTPAHDWANYPDMIEEFVDRLRGVVIENRDASLVLIQQDAPDALHYVDPPYVHSTRSSPKVYSFEMDDVAHEQLCATLRGLEGMVILSGYRCELYDEMYGDWERRDRASLADGARERTESLWFSPAAYAALSHGPLFQ